MNKSVGAIILNYNDYDNTQKCIENLLTTSIGKIIVVDNQSSDNSFALLQNLENDKVLVVRSDRNGGYAYGNNFGVKYLITDTTIEYLLILNPDVIIDENAISDLVCYLRKHEKVKLVSNLCVDTGCDKTVQAWKLFDFKAALMSMLITTRKLFLPRLVEYTPEQLSQSELIVDTLSGPCLLFEKKAFLEMGMFDESVFLFCEENMTAHRLKKLNYQSALINTSKYYHQHSATIMKTLKSEKKKSIIMNVSRDIFMEKYIQPKGLKKLLYLCFKILRKLDNIIAFTHYYRVERRQKNEKN